MTFTAVTFAPVQSFIRSSRKLRDLYGSSLLLSHLARALYNDATKINPEAVISPAEVNGTRGVPNTLLIQGSYSRAEAEQALLTAWAATLKACRDWLEQTLTGSPLDPGDWDTSWGPCWKACARHSWELFHGQGASIAAAEHALSLHKQARAWEIPNWTGESSTLSSTQAVVRPRMAEKHDPRRLSEAESEAQRQEARDFLQRLCQHQALGEAFAGTNEEISLTELVKRLVTYPVVAAKAFQVPAAELPQIIPSRFNSLSAVSGADKDPPESIVWFMADGDKVGDYIRSWSKSGDEVRARRTFSSGMRQWAADLYTQVPQEMGDDRATLVYAGGDDLFGALHERQPGARDLSRDDLFRWLRLFPSLWKRHGQPLTASMGLVWADSQVPQREALQQARDAEAAAKARGRDRFALRLVYAGGNHLQWTCPWSWLDPILHSYRDREGRCWPGEPDTAERRGDPRKWRHLAEDLLWLQERHAIGEAIPPVATAEAQPTPLAKADSLAKTSAAAKTDAPAKANAPANANAVARALLDAYFPDLNLPLLPAESSPPEPRPGFAPSLDQPERGRQLHQWLIDLGQVMAGLERWRDGLKESPR